MLARWSPMGELMNRFDPYRSFGDLRSEVNRIFGSFLGGGGGPTAVQGAGTPVVDMYATNDNLVVTVELPGVSDKDVQLSVTGDVLSIRGKRLDADEAKDAHYYWGERWFGQFERHIALPFPVNADSITAAFKEGVLTVTLPKADEIKPRQIRVEAS
jgi:HSP20 family protein